MIDVLKYCDVSLNKDQNLDNFFKDCSFIIFLNCVDTINNKFNDYTNTITNTINKDIEDLKKMYDDVNHKKCLIEQSKDLNKKYIYYLVENKYIVKEIKIIDICKIIKKNLYFSQI